MLAARSLKGKTQAGGPPDHEVPKVATTPAGDGKGSLSSGFALSVPHTTADSAQAPSLSLIIMCKP